MLLCCSRFTKDVRGGGTRVCTCSSEGLPALLSNEPNRQPVLLSPNLKTDVPSAPAHHTPSIVPATEQRTLGAAWFWEDASDFQWHT